MKVLHVYNVHRQGGGSDNAWFETIRLSREAGLEIEVFARDSRDLAPGLKGKADAFVSGIYARDAVRDFSRTLAETRPDVVHTHELYPLISPWVLRACRRAGVPVVHTCYDYRLTCPVATHFRKGEICLRCLDGREHQAVLNDCRDNLAESLAYGLRSAVARKARLFEDNVDHFIVLADFGRRWLMRERGVAAERITVNHCAIAPPQEAAANPATGSYVAFAGRFVPEKGVEDLIAAARLTGLPVRLAGNAPSHPAIRPGDPVECVLTPTRQDLIDFYRGARMLVVPSIWHEAFGIVAGEAMSHGVPVLASRIGGLPDVVVDGVAGLLFDAGDVGDLAAQMRRLWDDPALCARLGAAGRQRALNDFGGPAHVRRMLAAYAAAREHAAATSARRP